MISINYRDSKPIYEQIKDNYRRLILSGVFSEGTRLPSVRELAAELAINPNTIQRAYRELELEGVICTVPGKGSYVCSVSDLSELRKRELLNSLQSVVAELCLLGFSLEEITEMIGDMTDDDKS